MFILMSPVSSDNYSLSDIDESCKKSYLSFQNQNKQNR